MSKSINEIGLMEVSDEELDFEENSLFAERFREEFFDLSIVKVETLDSLLIWCSKKKVSDITIQSDDYVRAEIGGIHYKITQEKVPHFNCLVIAKLLFSEAVQLILDGGGDIDTSYQVQEEKDSFDRIRYRVNITAGYGLSGIGYQISIRPLPKEPIPADKLNIEQEIIDNFKKPNGLNLVTGPTGSGKSTLMASLIDDICLKPEESRKVITFEAPIEVVFNNDNYKHSFVFQSEVGKNLKLSNSALLAGETEMSVCIKNTLRRKPSIIVLGETRDKTGAASCIEGSLTGHLIMTTLHTIGVIPSIRRMLQFFSESERIGIALDLVQVLNIIVTQILVDKIGGGKIAIKEYLVFTEELKYALYNSDQDKWLEVLRDFMENKKAPSQTISEAAKILFDKDLISNDTFQFLIKKGK